MGVIRHGILLLAGITIAVRAGATDFAPVPGADFGMASGMGVGSDGLVYIAGTFGGVFQSTDATATKFALLPGAGIENQPMDVFGIDSRSSPPVLYADMEDPTLQGRLGTGGVHRSVDGGLSWRPFSAGLQGDPGGAYAFIFNPVTGSMYALSQQGSGMFKASASSTGWTECHTDALNQGPAAVDRSTGDVYFFDVTENRLLRSVDDCDSFVRASAPGPTWAGPQNMVGRALPTLTVDPSTSPSTLYVSFEDGWTQNATGEPGCQVVSPGGLFRSVDRGSSWVQVDAGLPTSVSAVAVSPKGLLMVATHDLGTGYTTLFQSSDHGRSFQQGITGRAPFLPSGLPVEFIDDQTLLVNGAGISRLTRPVGGSTWTRTRLTRADGLDLAPNINDFAFDSDGTIYAAWIGIWRSSDGGDTWQEADGSGSGFLSNLGVWHVAVDSTTHAVYAQTGSCLPENLFRSLDHGQTWTVAGRSPAAMVPAGLAVGTMPDSATGILSVAGPAEGVDCPFFSDDEGVTCHEASCPSQLRGTTESVAVNPQTGDFYVGTTSSQVLRSTDNGRSFTLCGPSSHQPAAVYGGLFAFGFDLGGDLFAADTQHIWRSNDQCGTWSAVSGVEQGIRPSAIQTDAEGDLYLGSLFSPPYVMRSQDDGSSWQAFDDGLPVSLGVTALHLNPYDGYLYAGLVSAGLWRTADPVNAPTSCAGLPDGAACNDGNACTHGETCRAGVCGSPTSTVTCEPRDACHVAGTCDRVTGGCSTPLATDGTPCSLGVCLLGTCTAAPTDAGTPIADAGPDGGGATSHADAGLGHDAEDGGPTGSDACTPQRVAVRPGCGCGASDRVGPGSLWSFILCCLIAFRLSGSRLRRAASTVPHAERPLKDDESCDS